MKWTDLRTLQRRAALAATGGHWTAHGATLRYNGTALTPDLAALAADVLSAWLPTCNALLMARKKLNDRTEDADGTA